MDARVKGVGIEEKAEVVLGFPRGDLTAREEKVPRGNRLFEREKP